VTGLLIVPGIDGSGPEHWQSRWEADAGRAAVRIAPASWSAPDPDDWLAAISAAAEPGMVIVAHSLGCLATAMWFAEHGAGGLRGALLVAPPDRDRPGFPAAAAGFASPVAPLPVPSIVVASDDDPFATPEAARALASAWGSELVELPGLGHLNAASGLGAWPEGIAILDRLRA